MNITFASTVHHPFFTAMTTIAMAALYTFFLYNHISGVLSGSVNYFILLFVAIETLVIALLVVRKSPVQKSIKPIAWAVAGTGTFLPLLLMPQGTIVLHTLTGELLTVIGAILAFLAFLSLNTSYGTSPSLRKIKTKGMYRFVRHPIYFAYFFIYIGYLSLSFSVFNLMIILSLFGFLIARTHFEEEVLETDSQYIVYKQKVKSRIIPYLY